MNFATKEACDLELQRLEEEIRQTEKRLSQLEKILDENKESSKKMGEIQGKLLEKVDRITQTNPTLRVMQYYKNTLSQVISDQSFYGAADATAATKREVTGEILKMESKLEDLRRLRLECMTKIQEFTQGE